MYTSRLRHTNGKIYDEQNTNKKLIGIENSKRNRQQHLFLSKYLGMIGVVVAGKQMHRECRECNLFILLDNKNQKGNEIGQIADKQMVI